MALNNLRIIYNNLADLSTTTVTASSTASSATAVANVLKDAKGSVWRSGTSSNSTITATANTFNLSDSITSPNSGFGSIPAGALITGTGIPDNTIVTAGGNASTIVMSNAATTTASSVSLTFGFGATAVLLVDLGSAQTIGGVVLPFTNLNSSNASLTITGYTTIPTLGGTVNTPTITGGTQVFSQTTKCCPWNALAFPNWGTNPVGSNTYAYGGGTYARAWLTTANQAIPARYITITITDLNNINGYIEVSRLVIGQYWSPIYNTGYGMSSSIKDLSTHERTESGDLVSQRGPRYSALTFDLKWLDPSDRIQLTKIMLGNGLPRPLLISLFPDNGTTAVQGEMERAHQIYGKMVTLPGITYDMLDIYSTQFDIEEV